MKQNSKDTKTEKTKKFSSKDYTISITYSDSEFGVNKMKILIDEKTYYIIKKILPDSKLYKELSELKMDVDDDTKATLDELFHRYDKYKDKIKVTDILEHRNVEVRSLLINYYGIERLVDEGYAKVLDEKKWLKFFTWFNPLTHVEEFVDKEGTVDVYTLYGIKVSNNTTIKIVKCKDSSTDRWFYIPVNPNVEDDAIEAIASTIQLPTSKWRSVTVMEVSESEKDKGEHIDPIQIDYEAVYRQGDLILGKLKKGTKVSGLKHISSVTKSTYSMLKKET